MPMSRRMLPKALSPKAVSRFMEIKLQSLDCINSPELLCKFKEVSDHEIECHNIVQGDPENLRMIEATFHCEGHLRDGSCGLSIVLPEVVRVVETPEDLNS
jgi:hypothetical protein